MKKQTIEKLIKHLKAIKNSELSIPKYQELEGLSDRFIKNKVDQLKVDYTKGTVDDESYIEVINLYESVKSNKGRKCKDLQDTDNRSKVDIIRDENGKITNYSFTIYVKDKSPITGTLTRDEMSLVYRLYSSYGSNITQREVSRFFPEFSLCDFKRILRTFNITKASAPFPQHFIEEHSKEELLDIQFREKENDFLRSYEAEKVRQLDGQLKKYMKENSDLKEQLNSFSSILDSIDLSKFTWGNTELPTSKSDKDLFIWLSDMHVGASVSNMSIYNNEYNREEFGNRLNKVYETVVNSEGYDNIIVCNLGDSLDGYNGQTTRGGHGLPQNMNNKEQVKCFIEEMVNFFGKLASIPCNHIKYYAVGESNHGGDFEYAAQLGLASILRYADVECKIFDTFIGTFEHKGQYYVLCHGKDNVDMFKNWPLVLNDRTENYINQYLDSIGVMHATVVKGDLHQSATTYGKRFKYKSVGSLFGSSDWIHKNFGYSVPCCDYTISNGSEVLDSRVVLGTYINK